MRPSSRKTIPGTPIFRSSNPGSKSPRGFAKRRISTFFAIGVGKEAKFSFEFWVLGFEFCVCAGTRLITNCVSISPKTQNPKLKTNLTTRFRCGALHSPKVIRRWARVECSCLSEVFQRSDPIERRRGFGYRNHSGQMRLSKERQQ